MPLIVEAFFQLRAVDKIASRVHPERRSSIMLKKIKLGLLLSLLFSFFVSPKSLLAATPFSFGVAGDFGPYGSVTTFQKIGQLKPNFFVAVGDFQYNTDPESKWCNIVKDNINIGAGLPVGSSYGNNYPFTLISGDHEAGGVTTDGYIDNYTACLPDRMGWTVGSPGKYGWGDYYIDYPPTNPNTRFIALAPNMLFKGGIQYTFSKGSAHYNWASQTIDDARARGIKWIVVGNHHNWLTMGDKYTDAGADFFNLMLEKKVDLIFEGNEHNYQRSKQLAISSGCPSFSPWGYQSSTATNQSCIVDDGSDNNYTHGRGTVLVITGIGGIGNYPTRPGTGRAGFFAKYMESSNATFGYTQVNVTDQALTVSMIRASGGNFSDSFTISDTGVVIPPPSGTPIATPRPSNTPIATLPPSFPTPPPGTGGMCQKMYIPSYFYPGSLWTQAIGNASKIESMIINPNSGPGAGVDNAYLNTVTQAKNAGIRVYGYTHSQYGARSAATVKDEINKYKTWYGVTDIFVDEAANSASQIPYYQDLANYVHASSGARVVLNPGVTPDQGYMNVADAVMNFENTAAVYQTTSFPAWVNNYPANKFIHLVYNTPESSLANVIALSKTRNAGLLYVTHDNLPNPWDTLPTYMNSELSQLTCSGGGSTPQPTAARKSGDANADNIVDGLDYVVWLNNYQTSTSGGANTGDFNNDSKVDGVDYVVWLNNYGK